MNIKIRNIIGAFLLPLLASAQDFKQQFFEASEKDDKSKQEKVLKAWQAKSPNDPDLYISTFNFHINKGRSEVLALSTQQQSEETLVLTDSTGATAGFMGSVVSYDSDEVNKALSAIDKGIAMHPKRLDMRFGKIYLLKEDKRYDEFASEIVKTIKFAKTRHDWLWKGGEPLPDAEAFFLENIQGYVGMIYDTGNDALLPMMRQISEAVLDYYPNHVQSLSNVAITYLLANEFDKAIPVLLKAEKSNPKDTVVLNNIAEAYKRSGRNADAKRYYEKMILVGDERDQAYAREQMAKLN